MNTRPLPSWHPLAECVQDMTLRDYFAAKAMQGLLASDVNANMYEFARHAYQMADIMLEARNAAQ